MIAAAETWQTAGFGLYLHWPFCLAKCPYCDFNSHVAARVDQRRWADAFVAEIGRLAALTPGRTLSTIFFGGGTPSLMSPETVAAMIAAARRAWPMANDAEVTLEANPTSVEAGRFRAYRDAGVTRVSVGVQALDDGALRALGRRHSAAEARAAVALAASVFERVSLDLIYARQDQDVAAWRRELAEALALGTGHLSLYQLTVEPGTPFAARQAAGGLRGLPDEDLAADLYDATQEIMAAAGRPAYEVSNHAAPGAEARHNLIYWRSGDWAAAGPGAHGRLTLGAERLATAAHVAPAAWLDAVERAGGGDVTAETLSAEDAGREFVLMGLRLGEGISVSRWRAFGVPLPDDAVRALVADGMLATDGDRLVATTDGRRVLNAVVARLVS